ncbi:MAG: hypothetical protein ACFBSG_00310 [Leptolyngbyaceae cyanobacterium]
MSTITEFERELTIVATLQEEWQASRKKRQAELAQRRNEVLSNLNHHQQIREQTAANLRRALEAYYASVQVDTSLYLSQLGQQRQTMSRETANQLQSFDMELREAVAAQRAEHQLELEAISAEVAALKQAAHEQLTHYQTTRLAQRDPQKQALTESVDELKLTVSEYLTKISATRQATAVAEQTQRQRDREALAEQVDAMQADFAFYRQQRQAFRTGIRQAVWGDTPRVSPATEPTPPSRPARKSVVRQASPKPQPGTARPMAATLAAAAPVSKVTLAKAAKPNEEEVFDFLQTQSGGARLTEIESSLGINRFQAVDALRSLLQKELIVQKDRTYRIQEEAVL